MLDVPHARTKCFWKGQQCLGSLWMQPLDPGCVSRLLIFCGLSCRAGGEGAAAVLS